MKPTSVALLTEYFSPFDVGGAERSAQALARALQSAGVQVVVVTPNYGAEANEWLDGIEIVRLPFPQKLEPGQLARRSLLANPLLQLWHGIMVGRLIRRRAIDVIHVQNSGSVAMGALASIASNRPMVATIRDLAYLPADSPERNLAAAAAPSIKWVLDAWYAGLERRINVAALRRARRIVFVSHGLQTLYRRRMPPWLTGRSTVVHNIGPVPVQRPVQSSACQVLFVGKLSTGKGLHVLYDAIGRVCQQIPAARFELVGRPGTGWTPPPDSIASHVHCPGQLNEGAVAERMAAAAVLVSPSLWPEPLSRVLLEAMSRAVPIVATEVGGTIEAVDAESAVLVPPADPAALAAGIARVLGDRNYAASLAANASLRYRQLFTAERIVPQALDVYRSAL